MNRAGAVDVLTALRLRLEARGIAHAGVFGSVARGEASDSSDIDIVVTPARRLDLFDLGGVQDLLEQAFDGADVDLVVEPIRAASLKAAVQRDRVDVF